MNHMINTMAFAATLVGVSVASGGDEEEHFDVLLRIGQSGNLVTGAADEDGTPLAGNVRVFGAEFGETPGEPFFADEPGFQAVDGTFDPLRELRVDFASSILAWNGAGFEATDETVTLEFGPSSVTSGEAFVEGFTFTADSLGGFHDHFDITVNGDGGDPADQVYLVPLIIADTAGAFGSTQTFWFVMNLNMDESVHDAAIDYVEANFAPTPGTLVALFLAGMGRTRRRRA